MYEGWRQGEESITASTLLRAQAPSRQGTNELLVQRWATSSELRTEAEDEAVKHRAQRDLELQKQPRTHNHHCFRRDDPGYITTVR